MPHETDPGYSVTEGAIDAASVLSVVDEIPEWFQQFLDHRQASKPSAHTMKAYRRDFNAIANLLTDGEPIRLSPTDKLAIRCVQRLPHLPPTTKRPRSEPRWFCRRLELLDFDQGLVDPLGIVERRFELGRCDVVEVAVQAGGVVPSTPSPHAQSDSSQIRSATPI
ncbi:hypothetical protein [Mycolicibacterium chubuense]|uniref:hypothetical protein n=1 Tax=Mycolicibacterium chubuense TaxID=1800 RepID=UPI0005A026FD|nr:hypothetical protein [Mycolicibacterium chubuense]